MEPSSSEQAREKKKTKTWCSNRTFIVVKQGAMQMSKHTDNIKSGGER